MVLAELIITLCLGGAVAAVIFLLFFNKKVKVHGNKGKGKTAKHSQQKSSSKKKKKSKKKKGGAMSQSQRDVARAAAEMLKKLHPAELKPEMSLEDSEHLVSVFRRHTGPITGVAWHQSGKYLFSSSEDNFLYCWQNPTSSGINVLDNFGSIRSKDGGPFTVLTTLVTPPNTEDVDPLYVDHAVVEDEKKKDEEDPLWRYDTWSNSIFASTHRSFSLCGCEYKLTEKAVIESDGRQNRKQKWMDITMTSLLQTGFIKEDVDYMVIGPAGRFVAVSSKIHDLGIYFYDLYGKRQSKVTQQRIRQPTNSAAVKQLAHSAETPLIKVEGGPFKNYQMTLSADGKYLSIGTFKKDIRLWEIKYRKPTKRESWTGLRFDGVDVICKMENVHEESVQSVVFSCDSKYMISTSVKGRVKVWSIENVDFGRRRKPEMVFEHELGIGQIEDVVMSYQWDICAVLNEERKKVFIYRIQYAKSKMKLHCMFERVLFDEESNPEGKINVVKFSPDSTHVAVGCTDSDVRVYKIPTHKKSSK